MRNGAKLMLVNRSFIGETNQLENNTALPFLFFFYISFATEDDWGFLMGQFKLVLHFF